MRKTMFRWLVALAIILPGMMLTAFAAERTVTASGYCGGEGDGTNLTWTLYENGELVIEGTGAMPDYSIVGISTAPWSYLYQSITAVVIEPGVTSVGMFTFMGHENLLTVTIPDSVTTIGYQAFRDCSKLTNVVIPGSVTTMSDAVFSGCGNLTSAGPIGGNYSIQFGWDTATPINAFSNSNLTQITLPNTMTTIGNFAFWGCTGLTEFTIPDSVTTIGNNAFGGCTGLTELTIPSSVTTIGHSAFSGCTGLTTAGPIGGNYGIQFGWDTVIPDSAFKGLCSTNITLPKTLTSIGEEAFFDCENLTIVIPASVTTIEDNAFSNCRKLTISIPASITAIGHGVFSECSEMAVFYGGTESQWYEFLDRNIRFGNDSLGTVVPVFVYLSGQPADVTVTAGESAMFTVEAAGDIQFYQWQYKGKNSTDWTDIPAFASTLTILAEEVVADISGNQYRCKIVDNKGDVAYSDAAMLTVKTGTDITVPAIRFKFALQVVNTIVVDGQAVDICRWVWTPIEG